MTCTSRRSSWRAAVALSLAGLLLLIGVMGARADNVYNTLDTSIDPALETLGLSTTTGSTTIKIAPTNDDTKNGCNLTGSTTLTVAVGSDNPAVATVGPSSLTFTSCGQVETVTVTPQAAGNANILFSVVANDTGASFNVSTANFSVTVTAPAPVDSTPPVITPTIVGTLGNNGWYTSNVSLTWAVTDGQSTVSSASGCGATNITADQAVTTYTCTATSAGGTNSVSVNIGGDATAPVSVSGAPTTAPNLAGWYTSPVTAAFTGTDAISGVASCTVVEGATAPVSGTCTDYAGNTSAATTSSAFNYDDTNPRMGVSATSKGAAYLGSTWTNDTVTVTFTCTDGGSGVASVVDNEGPLTAPYARMLGGEGADRSWGATCTDKAGNSTSTSFDHIQIDRTAPTNVSGAPTRDPDSNGWYTSPVDIQFSGNGDISGIANCILVRNATAPVSGTCTDNAGNTSDAVTSAAFNYDATAPSINVLNVKTVDVTNAVTGNYTQGTWTNQTVRVRWTCDDGSGSGVVTNDNTQNGVHTRYVEREGTDREVTGICADKAGNTVQDVYGNIDIDKTAPSAPTASFSKDAVGGWYKDTVTVSFGGSSEPALQDGTAGSGVASYTAAQTFTVSGSYSGTVTDRAGNVSTAVTGSVQVDAAAPAISCGTAATTWSQTDASIACTATDGDSGLTTATDASFNLTTSVAAGTETADAQTGLREICDNVGHCATAGPIGGNKADKKAPAISGADVNDPTWRNTDLAKSFTASDGGSGLANAADANFTLTAAAESTNATTPTTVSKTVADAVGNSATRRVSALIDLTAPTIQANATTADGATYSGAWTNQTVTVYFTCTDALSGVATGACPVDVVVSADTAASGQLVTGSVSDRAGNVSAPTPPIAVKVDKSGPTGITFDRGITNGATYVYGSVPAAPTCSAVDGGSGLKDCVVTGYSEGVGTHTLTATATDNVGNSAAAQIAYTVQPWTSNGFYAPVDYGKTNTIRGGNVVPLKFEVFAGGVEIKDASLVKVVITSSASCGATAGDEIEVLEAGATALRFDATSDQFIMNWKTPAGSGCYRATITTADGTVIAGPDGTTPLAVALFQTRK